MADTTGKPPADRYPDSEGPFAGPNNTFPLNTAGRVKNEWARIHQGPTRANHSSAEIGGIIAKIRARAKELGIELEESDDTPRSIGDGGNVEHRLTMMRVEVRAIDDGPSRQIGGYAAVFNSDSRRMGFGIERVAPSAFNEDRSAGWPGIGIGVVCRYNHENNFLLGTTQGGTLRLGVDGTGLDYTVDVPECRSDVLELVGRRDVAASSFSFSVAPGGEEWRHNDAGDIERTLLGVSLVDVAPVGGALAAYPHATVALRSLAAYKHADPDDVYDLARRNELRRLFVDTSGPPPAPPEAEPEAEPAEPEQLELDVQPPATLSWQEAKLHLYSRRPYDPISVQPRPGMAETERKVRL